MATRHHFAGKGRLAYKGTTKHHIVCACFFIIEIICWVGWAQGSMLAAFLLPFFFWVTMVNVARTLTDPAGALPPELPSDPADATLKAELVLCSNSREGG